MTRSTARSSGSGSSGDPSPAPRKTAAKKSAAKKTAKATSAPKKASPTKAPVKKSAAEGRTTKPSPAADTSSGRPRASQIALQAAAQLLDLTGKEAEGVVGIRRSEDGWAVQVEVLELRRIPSTTDVLAIYEVVVDEDGELASYRRLQRYVRGTPGGADQ